MIADTKSLDAFCKRLAHAPYVAVDTEFMRDTTYWPRLCLVQVAGPEDEAVIDPLAKCIELKPLLKLMADARVLKVFHAARQDMEIFFHMMGDVPRPIFDTQVAAMVCGFGEQVSYETLVTHYAGARVDKSSRFTDWSHRPLTERQLAYALSDVTHLRTVYAGLSERLQKTGRESWLDEEMATLLDPVTYRLDPEEAWQRLKPRGMSRKALGVLKEVAAWREREAQKRDLPRGRLVKDEALLEIAASQPKRAEDLARVRAFPRGNAEGALGKALLEAVARGLALPADALPAPTERPHVPRGLGPVVEMLKVLLKMTCEKHHVAAKLVASAADLERIAAGEADVPALAGWRREVFGEDALALLDGRLGLAVERGHVKTVVHDGGKRGRG
ncbi:MAG: ribonuclease D [Alphaproteobacteria bacterium]|nr:ribonuclease D [Alphaproteobacteria bacterium]